MPITGRYQELRVWRRSLTFVESVYQLSSAFPPEEKFGLTRQVRRCAVSIPGNIAEGSQRSGQRDFLRFLGIAAGSLAEAETYLLLGLRLGFVDQAQLAPVWELSAEVGRMLNGLKRSLR